MGVSLRCASGRRASGYAIASVLRLRSALLTHPPHASRKPHFDALPSFYTHSYFTLLDVHYQLLIGLKFFTLFQLRSFYLI
ncbi:MAG: hypothetical protein NZ455_12625 [Bacteroidia bacterium]|nr:hypothetical protein [Bacteroidia bacterium]MDW8346320.1 hypothetical protein [Bacteroidia bacterium]